MCTASLMFSPPSSGSVGLLVSATLRHEPNHGRLASEEEPIESRPAFTQYQTPRRTPATSLILRSITPSSYQRPFLMSGSKRQALFNGSPARLERTCEGFDILVCLPVEVSILILEYLHPKDLCQICLVSRDWYRLSQHPPLLKERRNYVKALREDYQLSKENYPPSTLRDSGTPQQPPPPTSASSTSTAGFGPPSRQMTVGQSPLNVIQPRTGINQTSGSRRQTHTTTPSHVAHSPAHTRQGSGQTPCPAYLLEDVQKLSLEDGVAEVRRCLFPATVVEVSPISHGHKGTHSAAAGARQAWTTSQQRNGYKSAATKGELMAGKKTNRSRLRRL